MTDALRKKIARRSVEAIALSRGGNPKRLQKSPSQKKSESLRKKLNRSAPTTIETVMSDCRNCGGLPGCDSDISRCSMRSLVIRCGKCGQKVRVRVVDDGEDKYLCPVCRVLVQVQVRE